MNDVNIIMWGFWCVDFVFSWDFTPLSGCCIHHRRSMPVNLWLLYASSRRHLMLTLYRKGIPLWCLKAASEPLKLLYKHFVFGLWQDISLLFITRTAFQQPAETSLNEVKGLCDIQHFFFFPEKRLSFPSYSCLFDSETWAALRGAKWWKGRVANRLSRPYNFWVLRSVGVFRFLQLPIYETELRFCVCACVYFVFFRHM